MTAQPVDPWTGHDHPENVACPPDCPKAPPLEVVATSEPETETDPEESAPEGEPTMLEKVAAAKKTVAAKPARGKARKSGKSAASEEGEKQADEMTASMGNPKGDIDVEREEWFKSPGFQRMRTSWEGEDKRQMERVQGAIDKVVFETFSDAYAVMSDLYDLVREPVTDEHGEIQTDLAGFTVWAKNPLTGAYIEDWTMLTTREREHYLFRITTALFEWEQRSANLWTRAMMSKGMFVEHFSIAYDAPISGTIDDRNAVGNAKAAEDRYFALMNSSISRKAEALVRSMTTLQLRLKDSLGQ